MTESAPQEDSPLNPADELHRMLSAWRLIPDKQPAMTTRGGPEGYWVNTVRAVELLEACVEQQEKQLAGTKRRVNHEAVDRMRRAILSTRYGMELQDSGTREIISTNDLDLLESWATGWHSTPADAKGLLDLIEAQDLVSEITSYLEGDADLPTENQRYLLVLARALQDALRDFSTGSEDNIAALASQLAMAVAAFMPTEDQNRTTFIKRLGLTAVRLMMKGGGVAATTYISLETTDHAPEISRAMIDLAHMLGR